MPSQQHTHITRESHHTPTPHTHTTPVQVDRQCRSNAFSSDTDEEPSDNNSTEVVRRRRTKSTPTDTPTAQDEDDYEDIDAHLDQDSQNNIRRSDYINWVYLDSDGEEVGGSKEKRSHDRYAPSIKLDRHPALKKSQSNMEIDATAANAAAEFIDGLKRRPKNRAPPPPPGKRQPKDKVQAASLLTSDTKGRGHKRSHSDLHLSGYAQEQGSSASQRPPPYGGQGSKVTQTQHHDQHSPALKRGAANRLSPNQKSKSPENPKRSEYVHLGIRGQSKEVVKPKRQAPPPPLNRRVTEGTSAEYASVNKQRSRPGEQVGWNRCMLHTNQSRFER